ncbi:MAG: NlpC/P60 family protein [Acetatifactor sp.]
MKEQKLRVKNRITAGVLTGLLCASVPVHTSAGFDMQLQNVGVADVLEAIYTEEEYVTMAREAVGAFWGYTNIGIAPEEHSPVYIRKTPDENGDIAGMMYQNAACELGEEAEGWVHVVSGRTEGYVQADQLLTGPEARLYAQEIVETRAVCTADSLRVRKGPSSEAEVIGQLSREEVATVMETGGEWIGISFDGQEGFVSAEYVTIEESLPTAVSMNKLIYGVDISDERAELVEYAKQFIGNPYVWGGTSLTKGADCSGFVLSIFKKFGVTLPHYSGAQAEKGKKIKTSELLPGDVIFYGNDRGVINHVAIYIGNDEVIHASSPKNGIMYSKYNYRKPLKCVRYLDE